MAYCKLEAGDVKKAEKQATDAGYAKLSSLRNAAKRNTIMGEIQANGGLKNALETLHSILRGSNKLLRDSVESAWHSKRDGWLSALNNELYKAGLKKVSESGELDKEVSVAMFKISNGENPGAGPAAKIGKLFSTLLEKVKDTQNEAGANIGHAQDYVARTQYDPVKMRQSAGVGKTADEAFEAWWAKSRPRMSEKNFEGVAANDQKAIGRQMFDALITGVHYTVGGAEETGFIPKDFANTVNIGQKVSEHRTISWKDGESWYENMRDYGRYPTIHAAVSMAADRGARATALIERLGTNPAGNLNMLMRRIQATYRSDLDGIKAFQNGSQSVLNEMGRLDGSLDIPANMGFAKGAASLRTWESMSSLGGVGITHFASIWPTVTSELAHHGVNRLESMGNMIKALFTGMGDAGHRDMMADLGAYADGPLRNMRHVYGDDTVPGRISSFAGRFMDMTGIHVLFDRTKAGIRDMLAHNLARNVGKEWGELDPNLSQMLGKYRITPEDWDAMRKAEMPTHNDRAYMTPAVAESMKSGLADKLLSYYSDAASHGVVQAGVREKALLLGASRPGTGIGELARFLTQFKMWPVAAMHQVLEREIYMSLSKQQAAWNIGMLMAIGVPAGYVRMSAQDLISGHPLRDPRDPRTLLAAAAQSGGLGIMGDFLFGETSRMGAGIISTLGGPVVSDADQLVKIFNGWKQGKMGWPDLAHFGVRHIPFANLFYVKGALDYLMWYHLYEAASPGWWERTNRRLQKEQGRTMTGYVPGGGVPKGIPGIYLNSGGQTSGLLGGKQ